MGSSSIVRSESAVEPGKEGMGGPGIWLDPNVRFQIYIYNCLFGMTDRNVERPVVETWETVPGGARRGPLGALGDVWGRERARHVGAGARGSVGGWGGVLSDWPNREGFSGMSGYGRVCLVGGVYVRVWGLMAFILRTTSKTT